MEEMFWGRVGRRRGVRGLAVAVVSARRKRRWSILGVSIVVLRGAVEDSGCGLVGDDL